MRYLLFAVLAFASTCAASAQPAYAIDKGSFLVGGTAGFQSQGYEDVDGRQTTITLNPTAGTFIVPGLAIGGEAIITRTSFDDLSSSTLGIGPFLAYFFGGPDSGTFPYFSGGVSYVSNDTEGTTLSGFGADVAAGVAIMLARNAAISLEGFAQFSSLSADGFEGSLGSNTFGARGGVSVFIY